MSYGSPDFGTVNIERPAPSKREAFWATAPREQFTRTCEQQYWDHMRNSTGDRMVSGAIVVGLIDGLPSKGTR